MKSKIIQQGAEAVIMKSGSEVIKRRVKKSYRLPVLDERLRKSRTKSEAKILHKLSKIIPVPPLVSTDEKNKEIRMQFIEGKKLSESLDSLKNSESVCLQIGENIAKLHDSDIIHGDLTTSNMIYSEKEDKVYFIDFGLSFHSSKIEDKAVDLHLIKEALEARHFRKHESFFASILKGYRISKNYREVLERLKKVELRGRYKKVY